jgi:hypothetical protein
LTKINIINKSVTRNLREEENLHQNDIAMMIAVAAADERLELNDGGTRRDNNDIISQSDIISL